MYKVVLLIAIFLFSAKICCSTETKYAVSEIPDSLLENANAVVRMDKSNIEYTSNCEMKHSKHYVITILKKNADHLSKINLEYDKFRKLDTYKGAIYDKNGKLIKKIKTSDFKDYSSYDGSSLFSDNRYVNYSPNINDYPYTIELIVEYTSHNLLYPIFWFSADYYDVAVQQSSMEVIVNKPLSHKFKGYNLLDSVKKRETDQITSYLWESRNMKAIESEPFSKGLNYAVPMVKFSLEEFSFENYPGSTKNWESFSRFIYQLSKSENKLSEKTIQDIKQICMNVTQEKEKVKAIYEYMQAKTRYVSIQLGIGGFKPFDASIVDKFGYGDCKALTNYTKALLNEAGIPSIYCLIYAGKNVLEIDSSFSSNQFNHVILCVPLEKDTIWLECTNQKIPFNYLGNFTGNRLALLILPEGGKLVYTQHYSPEKNLQSRNARIILTEGQSYAHIVTKYYGMQYENSFYISLENKEEQKRLLYEKLSIPNYSIKDYSFKNNKDSGPELIENLTLNLNRYCSSSGKRLFVPLNILNKNEYIPPTSKPRKNDIVISYPYYDCDTIVYQIPDGMKPEQEPFEKSIKSEFGEYSSIISYSENYVTYIRKYKQLTGEYSREKYPQFVSFMKQINQADNLKATLIKE